MMTLEQTRAMTVAYVSLKRIADAMETSNKLKAMKIRLHAGEQGTRQLNKQWMDYLDGIIGADA